MVQHNAVNLPEVLGNRDGLSSDPEETLGLAEAIQVMQDLINETYRLVATTSITHTDRERRHSIRDES